MIAAGMHPAEAGAIAAEIYGLGAASVLSPQKSPGSIRQQRWRDRNKASQSVTKETPVEASQSVSKRYESVTGDAASLSKIESNKEKKEKRESGASQLPEGWRPEASSWMESVSVLGSDSQAEYELRKFANHASEKGRLAKNWNAAWRNWATRAVEYAGGRPMNGASYAKNSNGRNTSLLDAIDRELAKTQREMRKLEGEGAENSDLAAPAYPLLGLSR
jgi:hypothetical protein